MDVDELVATYPRLWHMADASAWEGIRRHGLLSTSALLDLFEIQAERRAQLEEERRPRSVTITHEAHGAAVIRDQIPLREGPLEGCLVGMTAAEWYRTLNSKVFFWVSEDRVRRLLGARAYRDCQHLVLTFDTASLVGAHEQRTTLAPLNTGSTIFNPQPRGHQTFLSIADYPFDEWRRRRGVRDAVVELAVEYAVPDAVDHTVLAEIRAGDVVQELVFRG